MSNDKFLDILNDCIERMSTGESLDSCLRDYPHIEQNLRELLEMGQLIQQASYPDTEVINAQKRVEEEVSEKMAYQNYYGKQKRKNREVTLRHERIVSLATAAATLVLLAGIALFSAFSNSPKDDYASIAGLSANDMTGTEIVCQTQTAEVRSMTTPVYSASMTAEVHSGEIVSTSVVSMDPATTEEPDSDWVDGAMTATREVMGPTPYVFLTETPVPSALSEAATTATAITERLAGTPDSIIVSIPTGTYESLGGSSTSVVLSETDDGIGWESRADATVTVESGERVIDGTATMLPMASTPLPSMTMLPTATVNASNLPATYEYDPDAPAATGIAPSQILPTPTPELILPDLQPLSAGELDDNADWDNYLLYRYNYLRQYANSVHDVDVTGRQVIKVVDSDGLPVIGARVRVYMGAVLVSETCTYADGRTLFFPNANQFAQQAQSFRVVVDKDNSSNEFVLDPQQNFFWEVTLDNVDIARDSIKLDVLFLLDATGSMSDEIAELQNNILHISDQIEVLPGDVNVRYGLVTYRDRGDAYVTYVYDFSPDLDVFQTSLNSVRAGGGGDTPESLNEALHDALNGVNWRGEDTIKLVFLVADAPPHLDYPQDYDYAEEMVIAAQRGIKIHPIASSGLNPSGEFIFRQIAQYTMGHFIFLTYEGGVPGIAGDERDDLHVGEPDNPDDPQDVGDYTVEQLDELVLLLIKDELAALRGG